jgi:F-type H+-transporting ATPase subunit delta
VPDQVVSDRYAEALAGAIEEPGLLNEVCDEMMALAALVDENRELRAFLEGPNILDADKHALIDRTFGQRLSDITVDFLHLLLRKHRIDHLRGIAREFLRLVERRRNQIRIQIYTAFRMPEDMVDRLKRALDGTTGRDCILEPRVDARVLGGVVAVYEDQVIDGSLRSALDGIRRELMEATI